MPPHREIFPFWHCSDLKIYKHALFEDSEYLWRGHGKCFQSSHEEAIQLILNIFFVPGIALRTLYRLSCPNFIQTELSRDAFFLLLFSEAHMLEYFETYHSLSWKLKEKGGILRSIRFTINSFFWKALPCNCSIYLYVFVISDCFCFMYSIQKQKLNTVIELILTMWLQVCNLLSTSNTGMK